MNWKLFFGDVFRGLWVLPLVPIAFVLVVLAYAGRWFRETPDNAQPWNKD